MRSSLATLPSYVRPAIDMHVHPSFERTKTDVMLAGAQQVGITRIILCSVGYRDTVEYPSLDEVMRGNEQVYTLVERYSGFAFGLVYVNPNHPEALSVLEEGFRQSGVVGIKLWVSCRDGEGRLAPVYPVLEFAQSRQAPVLIHSFYRTGGNLRGELSPTDIAHLAPRYPRAPIVMAHLGGKWQRGVRVVRPYPNVFVDFSGSRAYLGSVEHAVRELGAGRVLFGSDAHYRSFAGQIAKVIAAEIDLTDKRRILWDNSARLFFGEGGEHDR
ncbi:MAG: amidohydrolase family protein [Ardenticatenia bacterium]|nr:amidohydrolase family protein [Ardenticatenia bacterium]